jgi:hypothetical protein
MAVCEVYGNDYDKAFEVTMMGETHTFDSFECAMHALAPVCDHCGVRVAGHGSSRTAGYSAALIAPRRRGRTSCAIAPEPHPLDRQRPADKRVRRHAA